MSAHKTFLESLDDSSAQMGTVATVLSVASLVSDSADAARRAVTRGSKRNRVLAGATFVAGVGQSARRTQQFIARSPRMPYGPTRSSDKELVVKIVTCSIGIAANARALRRGRHVFMRRGLSTLGRTTAALDLAVATTMLYEATSTLYDRHKREVHLMHEYAPAIAKAKASDLKSRFSRH